MYKQTNFDYNRHVKTKTGKLQYKEPRPLSPIFEDRKFKANINAKPKFKYVQSKYMQTNDYVLGLRQEAIKLKQKMIIDKQLHQERWAYKTDHLV